MITFPQFVTRVRQYGSIGARFHSRYDDVIDWALSAYLVWVNDNVSDPIEVGVLMREADVVIEREYERRVPSR